MKIQIENYTFDASNETITFDDYASIKEESIGVILNTTRDEVLYNPTNEDLNGTVSGNVLTLGRSTATMGSNDKLYIIYDDENVPASSVNQTSGDQRTKIYFEDADVSVQNPIPTDGDSVYKKDIDVENSDNGNFSGSVTDYFDSLKTVNNDDTANNPKTIKLWFNRSITTDAVGLGCDDGTKNFSNVVLKFLGSNEEVRYTQDLYQTDNTKMNSQLIQARPVACNGIQIEFHTADEVGLSNLIIYKSTHVISQIEGVDEVDGVVNNVKTKDGSLNVNQALVHTSGVNNYATKKTGTTDTLASAASQGDTSITLNDATGFAVNDYIEFTDASNFREVTTLRITAINTNTLTLDRPLDLDHPAGAEVQKVIRNMAVTGTLASPQSFTLMPPDTGDEDSIWQITKITFHIICATEPDDSLFGDIAALTNGLVIRSVKDNNIINTVALWKKNGDVANDVLPNHLDYTDKAGGGAYAVQAGWVLTNSEFIIEVDGRLGEYVEVLVQDDVSGLDELEVKFQGRIFGQ